jgi:hypothetical protein
MEIGGQPARADRQRLTAAAATGLARVSSEREGWHARDRRFWGVSMKGGKVAFEKMPRLLKILLGRSKMPGATY